MDGILIIYKEQGWTSHDVVAKLRGVCGQKKIGHTGTLDPDAEGVLVVCLGNATRASGLLTDRDKTYRAVLRLGVETDTQDSSGTVLARRDTAKLTEDSVRKTIAGFVGEGEQIPPMYSALKVNGQKLCDLARRGETVERQPRPVTIYDIAIEEMALPLVTMTVRCSKGTYIRTLCHDIGKRLGCGGVLEHLIRTESAGFSAEDALRIGEIQRLRDEDRLTEAVHPTEELFFDCPGIRVRREADRLLYNGNPIPVRLFEGTPPEDARIRVADADGVFCGLYRWDELTRSARPVKLFLPEKAKQKNGADSDGNS